jgi:hypothetical protein
MKPGYEAVETNKRKKEWLQGNGASRMVAKFALKCCLCPEAIGIGEEFIACAWRTAHIKCVGDKT